MNNNVIVHQSVKSNNKEGFVLTTRVVSGETGEIYSADTIVKYSFYWDSIILAAANEAVKYAEVNGYEVTGVDSEYYHSAVERDAVLKRGI